MMTQELVPVDAWSRLIREDFERRMKAASLSVKRLDSGVYFSPTVQRAWEAEKIIGSALPTYSQAALDAAVAAERERIAMRLEQAAAEYIASATDNKFLTDHGRALMTSASDWAQTMAESIRKGH